MLYNKFVKLIYTYSYLEVNFNRVQSFKKYFSIVFFFYFYTGR